MEVLLQNIEWVPVLVSTAVSFLLGWLWYSDHLFLKGWREGIGEPVWQAPMWMPMSAQLGSTLLLAIVINSQVASGDLTIAIVTGLAVAGVVKANAFYSSKTMYATSVEVGYVVAMVIVMILTNLWL